MGRTSTGILARRWHSSQKTGSPTSIGETSTARVLLLGERYLDGLLEGDRLRAHTSLGFGNPKTLGNAYLLHRNLA